MGNYIVVLLQVGKGIEVTGLVTWKAFINKKNFDEWNTPERKKQFKVVREGVSREKAISIASYAANSIYYGMAIDQSKKPDGSINTQLLYLRLVEILYAQEHLFEQRH